MDERTLRRRIAAELSVEFRADRPITVYSIDEDLVASQQRDDREVNLFSFDQFDKHLPFTLRISLGDLQHATTDQLEIDLDAPGREWAKQILIRLHQQGLTAGLSIALARQVHTV